MLYEDADNDTRKPVFYVHYEVLQICGCLLSGSFDMIRSSARKMTLTLVCRECMEVVQL